MYKKNLEDKITIFLIANEKEKNYHEALDALNNQTVSFTFKQILDIEPLSTAFNQMLERCETPYFCQIDEDMVLKTNAIKTMYDTINKAWSNTAMVRFKLFDEYLQKIIGSVIIYDYEISKQFIWENTPNSDLLRYSKILQLGYKISTKNNVLGVHHPYWNLLSIFRKFAIEPKK